MQNIFKDADIEKRNNVMNKLIAKVLQLLELIIVIVECAMEL